MSLLLISYAHAGCSPYVGKATLNEYYHNNQSPDKAKEYFIESKLLDRGIPASTYKNWSILICSKYGPDKNSALSRCITGDSNIAAAYTDTTLDTNLTLASASGGQSWKVLDQSDFPAGYVDNNGGTDHGMEVFLLDQNGLIVDYTQVDGYSVHAGDLGASSCNYLYDNDYPGNNTFTMQRLPDGTGCWPQDPTSTTDTTANGTSISCLAAAPPSGSSGTPTQQAPNTDSPSSGTYPYLVISDVNVSPGSTATFTVSIAGVLNVTVSKGIYSYSYDSSVHTFSSDIIFNYASQDGTATATGGDYNAVTLTSATLAAGLSSTTVSVSTNSTASIGEYFYAIISESASDSSGALIIDNNGTATFTAPAIDHLAVSTATTSASTCSALAVTIQAQDAANNPVSNYAGTITLGTSSNHGDWSATPSSGSNPDAPVNALNPSPDTDDNGVVQYTFDGGAGGDGGSITLYLLNAHADNNVTITASDSANAVSASATGISFLDNVFLITPTTATAGIANSSTMIAGRPHSFSVALWTKDPTTGLCAIATGYNSAAQGTKVYIDRGGELLSAADPTLTDATTSKTISETIPAADNVTLDFSSGGSASFTLNTSDVGKYTLHISDDGNSFVAGKTVTGSIDLTAIPFAFTLDYSGQRAADLADNGNLDNSTGSDTSYALNAAGTAFLSAGSNFTLNIGAVLWDGADDADNNGVADTGANPYNNTLAPSFGSELSAASANFTSTLVLPTAASGGQSGILGASPTPLSSTAFSGGSASATLNWSEVGIIDIGLSMSGYLGATIPITGTMPYLGRFTPASYAVITSDGAYANTHTAGASAFTYVGESFGYQTDPAIQAYPLNIRQSMWASGQSYAAGDYILSSDGNGRVYKVTSGGSSGGTEPTWPTTTGATVTVNGVSYQDVGPITAYVTLNSSANGGEFNKLSGSALTTTLAATDTVSTLATSGDEGTLSSAPAYNLDGSLAFTLSGAAITLAHTTTPIAPFTPDIGIELASFIDTDGINFADGLTLQPSGNNQRYGRAVLSDTYGSSASGNTLGLPLTLQYFNGTDFVDNSDDTDSLFNSSLLGCTSTGTLACSDIAVLSADVANGEAYTLTANGTQGTLLYTLDLATAAPALQYDWSNSGTLSNPSASATFGTYRGDDRFLFWREIP